MDLSFVGIVDYLDFVSINNVRLTCKYYYYNNNLQTNYNKKINWQYLSRYGKLNGKFIIANFDRVSCRFMRRIPPDIAEHINASNQNNFSNLFWRKLSKQKLSETFILNNINNLYMIKIIKNNELSDRVIKTLIEQRFTYLYNELFKYQKCSPQLITWLINYEHVIENKYFYKYQTLNETHIKLLIDKDYLHKYLFRYVKINEATLIYILQYKKDFIPSYYILKYQTIPFNMFDTYFPYYKN